MQINQMLVIDKEDTISHELWILHIFVRKDDLLCKTPNRKRA